jgi:hypothetical protein
MRYLFVALLVTGIFLAGCGRADIEEKPGEETMNISASGDEPMITKFFYGKQAGSMPYIFSINIDENGDLVVDKIQLDIVEPGASENIIPLSRNKYEELVLLIEEERLESWDGFGKDQSRTIIPTDASGFHLEIQWSDGTSILANSIMEWPENFDEADQRIVDFFRLLVDVRRNELRDRAIALAGYMSVGDEDSALAMMDKTTQKAMEGKVATTWDSMVKSSGAFIKTGGYSMGFHPDDYVLVDLTLVFEYGTYIQYTIFDAKNLVTELYFIKRVIEA